MKPIDLNGKIKDKYNVPLTVGRLVAFNYSGAVCLGVLQSVQARCVYGKTKDHEGIPLATFHVEHIDNEGVSKITSRDNLVVVGNLP